MRATGVVVLVAVAWLSTPANASVRVQPGVNCEGLYQNWQFMYREERGIANVDTTRAWGVVCPAKIQDFANNNNTCFGGNYSMVVYYDDETNVDNFFCQMYKVSTTGAMTWGVGRYTCSTGG